MDELRTDRRFARRLLLAAAIQCTAGATSLPYYGHVCFAEPPKNVVRTKDDSLRSLLSNGFDDSAAKKKGWVAPVETPLSSAAKKSTRRVETELRPPISSQPVPLPELTITSRPQQDPRLVPLRIETKKAIQIQPPKQVFLLPPSDLPKPAVKPYRIDSLDSKSDFSRKLVGRVIQKEQREALNRIALDQGFSLLDPSRTPSVEILPAKPSEKTSNETVFQMPSALAKSPGKPVESILAAPVQRPSELSTVHAEKLRGVAQLHLRDAADRLRRGATFSAKRLTLKALQNIVQMRDLQDGGSQHARAFQSAMAAIRESRDFRDELGSIDHKAIKRLVAIHSTATLKSRDLGPVTSLHAMECYLLVAQTQLTDSLQGVAAASRALSLLGKIERSIADVSDTHAAATALTLHKAAVSIDPRNVVAQYELGENLYAQGLYGQAFDALSVCVNLRPDRRSYQLLMQVSKRLGNTGTANNCLVALRDPKLPSDTPVRRLNAKDFATTYQPANDMARNIQKQVASAPDPKKALEAKPVSTRTKIGSKWKGWISQKLR